MLIYTPEEQNIHDTRINIFLAGSIEMGSAENWQEYVIGVLKEDTTLTPNLIIYNPRRSSWDASWEQKQTNPQFNYQVNWEMDKLNNSDLLFFFFHPDTKSPISLFELGRYGRSHNTIVCCPDDFYRKGNIEIFCTRENISLYSDLDKAISALITKIRQINGK